MVGGMLFAGEVPNCVSPTAFQTEGKLYLILDFLRGGDLFTRLSKEVSELSKSQGDFWSRKEGGAALRGMDV